MKKIQFMMVVLIGICGVLAYAAQDTSIDVVEVRDPRRLKTYLEANAGDAETRIAAVEAAGVGGTLAPSKLIVGNNASNATAMAVTGDVTVTQDGTNLTTAIAADVIVAADVNPTGFAQADTNATTTTTAYTPAFRGQVLVGGAGTGTNAVWVAKGVTTNDWVQVAP